MSDRLIVSLEKLSEWLTDYVQAYEDCEGTVVRVQYKLKSPDSEGCNWSDTVVFNPGPNADKNVLTGIVGNAVREARDKFNVE
ncbi:MAG: hypothetical protein M8364_21385 [Methylobacter sp.]|uniref:hypothetical protein n=1 Tax=Methylobacter sp. TaxID=2051955 RepID=UPI002585D86A|nr:hypothetical protein [Methylobacter sp.]MCL7423447.1 hypothetical protein [Methylobacter sp.]